MTVACQGNICGYEDSSFGSLVNDMFDYGGERKITGISYDSSGNDLEITLKDGQSFTSQMIESLTFRFGSDSFALSEASFDPDSQVAAWVDKDGDISWMNGNMITVTIRYSTTFKIHGDPRVGETLSADTSDRVATLPEGTSCRWYQWNLDEGGYINKNLHVGDCEYTLTDEDVGEYIRAELRYEDSPYDLLSSNTLGPVEEAEATPPQTGPPPPRTGPPPPPESGEDEDEGEASCPEPPRTTARDVTDRETLKEFVQGSVPGIKAELEEQNEELKKCYGEQGHWRDGSVYLFVITDDGTFLFDAIHNEELKDRRLVAVDHKGNDVWEKIDEALEGDGYAEYYWDDPSTGNDDNTNPDWLEDGESPGTSRKVSYVEEFSTSEGDFIIGSGIYVEEAEEEVVGPPQDVSGTEEDSGGGCAVTYSDKVGTGSAATGMFFALALIWALQGKKKSDQRSFSH